MVAILKLIEQIKNIDTDTTVCVIQFPSFEGISTAAIDRNKLLSTREALSDLLRRGAILPDVSQATSELEAMRARDDMPFRKVTSRGGWYDGRLVTAFGEGGKGGPMRFARDPGQQLRRSRGRLADYRDGMTALVTKSNYLPFVLAAALTPALASFIGRKGGCAFVLTGESTTGKTLALRTCNSMTSSGEESDLITLNMTLGRPSQLLVERGATCICFGDPKASQAKGTDFIKLLQTLSFAIAEGTQRSTMIQPKIKAPDFVMACLTAERPVCELYAAGHMDFDQGDAIRIIDIPVPSPEDGGIFDRPPSGSGSSAIAVELEEMLEKFYGRATFNWALRLANASPTTVDKAIKLREARFLKRLGALTGQERRLAKPFALIASVGFYAAKQGVLPCTSREIEEAVTTIFARARERFNKAFSINDDEAAAFIKHLAEENFPTLELGRPPADAAACYNGFRRRDKGGERLYVRPAFAASQFTDQSFFYGRFLASLVREGLLIRAKSKVGTQVKQKGLPGRHRYYVFEVAKIENRRLQG